MHQGLLRGSYTETAMRRKQHTTVFGNEETYMESTYIKHIGMGPP